MLKANFLENNKTWGAMPLNAPVATGLRGRIATRSQPMHFDPGQKMAKVVTGCHGHFVT